MGLIGAADFTSGARFGFAAQSGYTGRAFTAKGRASRQLRPIRK
jgi:hypothetical protein